MVTSTKIIPKTIRAHRTTTTTRSQSPIPSRVSETRCSPERTTTGPKPAIRTLPRHWKSISVSRVLRCIVDRDRLTRNPSESLRYLDQHHALPDDTPQLKDEFDELRTVLLNNSALAALRAQPPDPTLAEHQATRANLLAVKIEHKGRSCSLRAPTRVFTGNHCSESTLPSRTR